MRGHRMARRSSFDLSYSCAACLRCAIRVTKLASVELEARWQFFGRWSVVAFGGAGETRTTRQTFAATQTVGSGGVGFRYSLASKFGMHAGIDVAHSPGTTAFYIVVGSAWFRP